MLLNCDLVIAGEDAVIATPEVKRGVLAVMGGRHPVRCDHGVFDTHVEFAVIPRLARVAGHQVSTHLLRGTIICSPSLQLASEMLLTGRNLTAHEAATRFGL